MEEVYSCLVDTRGGSTAPARRRELELARPAGLAFRRPRRELAGDAQRRDPLPRGHRGDPGSRLAAHPGRRGGRRLRRHGARRRLALHRPRRDVHPRAGPVGPPRAPGVGRRLRRAGLPHDPSAPDRPAVRDGRHLHRRRLPDHRRRRVVAGAQPGHQGRVPAGGPAVPAVRPVRAQGDAAPRASGAALPPEPRRRLPLRRRGRRLEVDRRRPARRVRVPDRGPPPRARTRSTSSRSATAPAATRRTARPAVWRSRDAGETWEELA